MGKADAGACDRIGHLTAWTRRAAAGREGFQHAAGAGMIKVREPERDRILMRELGQIVDCGFERKHVAKCAERAQRRGAKRHVSNPVVDDAHRVEAVGWNGISLGAAACSERSVYRLAGFEPVRCDFGCGEQRGRGCATGAKAVPCAPDLVFPACDVTALHPGANPHGHGRTEWCADQFVVPRPEHPDWRAAGACDEGGIKGHIIGRIVSVAAGALRVMHHDVGIREHERQIGAQVVGTLAVRPDVESLTGPMRKCAGRHERGVGDEGFGEDGFIGWGVGVALRGRGAPADLASRYCAAFRGGCLGGVLCNDSRFRGLCTQPVRDRFIVKRQTWLLPAGGCGQMFGGADGQPFTLGHHRKKIAVADESHAVAE